MTKFNFNKGLTALIFFLIAVFLLAVDLTLPSLLDPREKKIAVRLSDEDLESFFFLALQDVGMQDDWISPITRRGKQAAENYPAYKVDVPKDLPIPVILNEIFIKFRGYNVDILSEELYAGGRSSLKILSGGETKIHAEFNYKDQIRRKASNIGLVLYDIEDLGKNDSLILALPESFAVVLIPSKNTVEYKRRLQNFRKEYILLIGDDTRDLEYKLSPGYSTNRLKSSIRSIIGSFSDAVFFIVDDNSKFFNSAAFQLAKGEFEKNNIKLINKNSIEEASAEQGEDGMNHFRKSVINTGDGMTKLLFINASEFMDLRDDMIKLRKIGYKFIYPSRAVSEL